MELLIPVMCFALAGGVAVFCMRGARVGLFWLGIALLLAGFVINSSLDARTPGFDGISNAIYAWMFFAPALLGAGLGGLFGWWRWRRT